LTTHEAPILAHPVTGEMVMFVYKDNRVKVKVTSAKNGPKSLLPYVKLPSAITPVL